MFECENRAKISRWLKFVGHFAMPAASIVYRLVQVGALFGAAHVTWPVLLWRLCGLTGSLFSMWSARNRWCACKEGEKGDRGKSQV